MLSFEFGETRRESGYVLSGASPEGGLWNHQFEHRFLWQIGRTPSNKS
jgi:deoxyribodipyrimidine photolyase-like uncharacterized protein